MRRRALSALLAVILLLSLLPLTAQAASVTDDDVIRAVLVVFRCREGTYDSVNRDDNGALSLGKLQWHGGRALELMKQIVAADPANALATLGDSLFQEITTAGRGAWDCRILNPEEGALVGRLLGGTVSVRIQDAMAKKDISIYLSHARTYDIRTAEAMVYYCDIENQYGTGGAADLVSRVKGLLGKSSIDSVDEFHGALVRVTSNYLNRRNWTYEYCRSLDWSNLEWTGPVENPVPVVPINVDIEPPKITAARLVPLDAERFQVEVNAKDNKRVTDCRVQLGTDADDVVDWAAYAKTSGSLWILPVSTRKFSADASRYYVTVTVSDAAGNAASTRLELARADLEDIPSDCDHRFRAAYDTPATCTEPECRVEECELCGRRRKTVLSAALGHDFAPTDVPGEYKCTRCGATEQISGPAEKLPGVLEQAALRIIESCQKQNG